MQSRDLGLGLAADRDSGRQGRGQAWCTHRARQLWPSSEGSAYQASTDWPSACFDGRPTYVRSKAIGARLPASPAAAEIHARINTYPPSPFDCEHHAGGAYVRRAPKLPRRTSDTPKAVREVDDRVSRRLGGTTYRVPPPSRRGEANVQDVAGGKDAQEHAARLGFEAIDSGRHLAWSALPPEVQQSARNLSAHIDAMADVAVEDGAETSVLVIRVSEQACGHVAYMVAAPEDLQLAQLALLEKAGAAHQQEVLAKEEQARLAESVKEIGGGGAFEASAFRRASKIVSMAAPRRVAVRARGTRPRERSRWLNQFDSRRE